MLCFCALFQYLGIQLTKRHFLNPENGDEQRSVCIIGNLVVIRCYLDYRQCTMRVFNISNGDLVSTWPVNCHHYPPTGPLVPYGRHDQFILETCQFCALIRAHDVTTQESFVACSGLSVKNMCEGPNQTLLTMTTSDTKMLQLLQDDTAAEEDAIFQKLRVVNINTNNVRGMEYFRASDMVVLSKPGRLKGIKLSTQQLIWQWDGSLGNVQLNPYDVTRSFPYQHACVANGENILILKAADGSFQEKITLEDDIDSALWFGDTFVTKRANGRITIYKITVQPSYQWQ